MRVSCGRHTFMLNRYCLTPGFRENTFARPECIMRNLQITNIEMLRRNTTIQKITSTMCNYSLFFFKIRGMEKV